MPTSCEAIKVVLKSLDRVLNDVSLVDTPNYFFLLRAERVYCRGVGLFDFTATAKVNGELKKVVFSFVFSVRGSNVHHGPPAQDDVGYPWKWSQTLRALV